MSWGVFMRWKTSQCNPFFPSTDWVVWAPEPYQWSNQSGSKWGSLLIFSRGCFHSSLPHSLDDLPIWTQQVEHQTIFFYWRWYHSFLNKIYHIVKPLDNVQNGRNCWILFNNLLVEETMFRLQSFLELIHICWELQPIYKWQNPRPSDLGSWALPKLVNDSLKRLPLMTQIGQVGCFIGFWSPNLYCHCFVR